MLTNKSVHCKITILLVLIMHKTIDDIAKLFHFIMTEQNVGAIVFHYKAAIGLFPNSQCITTNCYYDF